MLLFCFIGTESVSAKKQRNNESLNEQIKSKKSHIKKVEKEEGSILHVLNEIDKKLEKKNSELKIYEYNFNRTKIKIENIKKKIDAQEQKMNKRKSLLVKRLQAIHRYAQIGFLGCVLSANSLSELFQRYNMLKYIIEYDKNLILENKQAIKEIEKEKKELDKYRDRILYYQKEVVKQESELEIKQRERKKLLKSVRINKDKQKALLRDLEKAAKDLERKIREKKRRYKERTSPPPYKGKLLWPVKGEVIIGFGEQKDSQLGVKIQNKGIDIQSPYGEHVYAVTSGKILYADWFQGYGKMIIIDHGDDYCTIYAHLSKILVKKGDTVPLGHKIASVGDTCSIHGPELYFEIRYRGNPLNPLKWLSTKKGK
ncbi:MAG: murein hydrolase activator EnvC family protein [bacterium]